MRAIVILRVQQWLSKLSKPSIKCFYKINRSTMWIGEYKHQSKIWVVSDDCWQRGKIASACSLGQFAPTLRFPWQPLHFFACFTMPEEHVSDTIRTETCRLHVSNIRPKSLDGLPTQPQNQKMQY